jgi:cytidylate kinase
MTHGTPPFTPRVRSPDEPVVVAIDGPAAAGKSSTARQVAQRLGMRHVDSGALYRVATAMAIRSGRPVEDWTGPSVVAAAGDVRLAPTQVTVEPTVGGLTLDEELRGHDVTQHVSRVARMPEVRAWVNDLVRLAAAGQSIVVDGRDMGTVVFPTATLKVFLQADPWERARRRLVQRLLRAPADLEIAEETERLVQRDARDALQLVRAPDAVVIDTTRLTQEEQVERIVALVRVATGLPSPREPY